MTKKGKRIGWIVLIFSLVAGCLLGYFLFNLGCKNPDTPLWLPLSVGSCYGFGMFAFLVLWIPWIIKRDDLWSDL